MKVGDKYRCKKSLRSVISYTTIDKYYCILRDREHHVMILSDSGYEAFAKVKNNSVSPYYFYDYFYTKQEERKFKLEKLCLNQEIE